MPKGFSKMEEAAIKASLLKSGRNRFVRTGLRGTTVDSLAQDAGISKGAFYKFFQSKEELFFDLVEEKEQEIRAKIKPNDLPDEPKLLAQFLLSLVKESLEDPLLRIISDPGEYQALLRKLPSERVQEHIQADEKDLGLSMGRFLKHRWGSELDEHILAGVLRAVMLLVLHPEELGPRSDEILLTILQGVLEKNEGIQ